MSGDGFELLAREDSERLESDSSGGKGDDVYSYGRPSFGANGSEFSSFESEVDGDIFDTGKLTFYVFFVTETVFLIV